MKTIQYKSNLYAEESVDVYVRIRAVQKSGNMQTYKNRILRTFDIKNI